MKEEEQAITLKYYQAQFELEAYNNQWNGFWVGRRVQPLEEESDIQQEQVDLEHSGSSSTECCRVLTDIINRENIEVSPTKPSKL